MRLFQRKSLVSTVSSVKKKNRGTCRGSFGFWFVHILIFYKDNHFEEPISTIITARILRKDKTARLEDATPSGIDSRRARHTRHSLLHVI